MEQIFKWYIEGISPNRISQKLNAEGVPTKLNSRLGWAEKTVSDLVCQEYYAGRCLRNVGRHDKKRKSPDKWIHIPAPRIISDEMWEAAKARRSQNKVRSPRNTKRVYITQHVLECEECGTRFHVAAGWGGLPRLMCFRMIRYPHSAPCRIPKSVDYGVVADQLWGGVVKVVGSEEGLEAAVLSNVNRVKGQKVTIEKRLKEVTAKRANFSTEKDRVISWARKGSISEEQMERQLRDITDEDKEYIAEQDRLLADLRLIGSGDEVYQQAQEYIPMMKSRVNDHLTESDKLEIIDSLVRRARLDGSGDLTIEFKTPRPKMSFGYLSSWLI